MLTSLTVAFRRCLLVSNRSLQSPIAIRFWIDAGQLVELAKFLAALFEQTGKRIRLAIEPEPFCVVETTPEAISFFERLNQRANSEGAAAEVREFIGLCYDVCHQSVEFEDVSESIQQLVAADVRINKVHITSAIRLENPATNLEGLAALARYAEPATYTKRSVVNLMEGLCEMLI